MLKFFICLCSLLIIIPCFSQLKLASLFSDNMILQRNKPIKIFGKGIPGETVVVKFGGSKKKSIVNKDSAWAILFKSQKENNKSQSIVIQSGSEKIVLKNILIGDVWLCIGQSNMEWPMKKETHYKPDGNLYENKFIRFYNPAYVGKGVFGIKYNDSLVQLLKENKLYQKTVWQQSDSNSIKEMSAVGYYFAKEIFEKTNIPIGLVNLSIGGAALETFINEQSFLSNVQFSKKVNGNWLYSDALPVWIRERGRQNVEGVLNILADKNGPAHAYKPGYAYKNGVEAFTKINIKGILCYQGESNAQEMERVNEYAALQKLLVDDYRKKWVDKNLPFYYVQISSIDTAKYKSQLWPQFRNEQLNAMELIPHSGMAVCSDIGFMNDVHPTNKKDVGERLARWALYKDYHKKIIPSGPLPVTAIYKNQKVIINFKYVAEGLKTSDEKDLRSFSIDAKNDTEARIKNNTVEIFSAKKPKYVYYGWQPFSTGNLVNAAMLPASTFRIKVD